MNRICVDENIPHAGEFFKDFGEVSCFAGRNLQPKDLQNCDVLIVRSITQVTSSLLKDTPVKWVGTATAGTNHINKRDLRELKIPWESAAGCNAQAVSEYVLALLLQEYKDPNSPYTQDDCIGIVGFGHVGQAVASKLSALNIPWKASDPPRAETCSDIEYFPLELLNNCPILTFHVPFIQEGDYPTHLMWNSQVMSQWHEPPLVINACRGEILKEGDFLTPSHQDPYQEARQPKIYADVFWNEPEPQLSYLQRVSLATPHIAGYSLRGKLNGSAILVDKLNQFLQGVQGHSPVSIYQDAFLHINSTMLWKGSLLESLYQWMKGHYDPWSDGTNFRETWNQDERGNLFDQLRKEYPNRPEFEDVKLNLKGLWPSEAITQLAALGFKF